MITFLENIQKKLLHLKVGYKTILHLAIDEDDFDATPFVEACLKVCGKSKCISEGHGGAGLACGPASAHCIHSKS